MVRVHQGPPHFRKSLEYFVILALTPAAYYLYALVDARLSSLSQGILGSVVFLTLSGFAVSLAVAPDPVDRQRVFYLVARKSQ